MVHGQQEVQPSIPLGRNWSKFPENMSQRDRIKIPYDNQQRLESHQAVQNPGGEGNQEKGESSHYLIYTRTADPDRVTQIPSGSQEEAKPALQWLHTIQEAADQWPRVTIIHHARTFPG
ncbi:hypothetical protein O181_005023 [Austropuccinia psidii MF-1]|uniref:Uncharacterized protein n=1 Tax=Austropuccinia psidii MF-1 TaxID=1389203 RepID=A0A9Q3GF51_9BASI|nr:hypothetical protein [Austropuccinia psidii MF-1]